MSGCYEQDTELLGILVDGEYYDQLADYQISMYHSAAIPSLIVRCEYGHST
jgi:hypothetical protein